MQQDNQQKDKKSIVSPEKVKELREKQRILKNKIVKK